MYIGRHNVALLKFNYYNPKLRLKPHNVEVRIKPNVVWHYSIFLYSVLIGMRAITRNSKYVR
jgi:hypothetical protein